LSVNQNNETDQIIRTVIPRSTRTVHGGDGRFSILYIDERALGR